MDKRILQTYSTWAKENLENQIEVSLKALGINGDQDIKIAKRVGDVTAIEGDSTSYPADLYGKRESIINLIKRSGYRNIIEEFAYTWFNRFVALRFMEVHGFLPHGFRILSNPAGGIEPEILKNLNLVKDDLRLDMHLCSEYKQQGKIEELFRHVLMKQCNVLSRILPMLFGSDMGYLELLLPKNLLKGETVVTRLNEIPEEAFMEDVEIIGWMYQFYISSKKDAVYASKKTITKDTLPAVTQLFTPDWIVRYMAQNSVGRLWLESYPNSTLRSEMKYYVEDAGQTEEVQKKIDEIKYKNVNPEEIRIIEPCCGSGHILVYVFDLLYKMYEERGYQKRDIPTLILKNNLVGLDVDKRAAQLASFSLIMKARSVNNRFFNAPYYEVPHVYELQDSKLLKDLGYRKQLMDLKLLNDEEMNLITYLVDTFENGKTIGSLLRVKTIDFACLDGALDKVSKSAVSTTFNMDFLNVGMERLMELSNLAKILSAKYDVMITNPPYINPSSMEAVVKEYATKNYPDSKTDMFAMFMETGFVKKNGFVSMINMHSWMFLSSYEKLRIALLKTKFIISMIHLGAHAFESIGGEVVQTTSFIMRNCCLNNAKSIYYRLVNDLTAEEKEFSFLNKTPIIFLNMLYEQTPYYMFLYWLKRDQIGLFNESRLEDYMEIKQGVATSDNNRFLRMWYEVQLGRIGFGYARSKAIKCEKKWFPYNKGGTPVRWYGNQDYIVNYYHDGAEMKAFHEELNKEHPGGRLKNQEFYFREGATWSTLSNTFAMRFCPHGFIFDTKGSMGFVNQPDEIFYFVALLNSVVGQYWMKTLAPTLDFNPIALRQVPVKIIRNGDIWDIAKYCISLAESDWNSFEISWDFKCHPLIPLLWRGAANGGGVVLESNESSGGVAGITGNHPGSYGATPPKEGNLGESGDAGISLKEGTVGYRNSRAYASLPYNPKLKERARELRKAGNLSEVILWTRLKSGQVNGWDFDRQKIIGNYIVDFYCANVGLVVEIDGSSHDDKQEYDAQRDEYLQGLGLTVLHFKDIDVKENVEGVVEAIRNHSLIPLLWRGAANGGGVVLDSDESSSGVAGITGNHPGSYGATPPKEGNLLVETYKMWEAECAARFNQLKSNEEELNRIFIDIYGLQDELTPDVADKDVTVRLADRERDIRSLISYLVGVAMGRYSLDVPGLAYAGGEWDASKYISYQPDDDGIIPIYSGIGMEDGLTTVLIRLIKQIYGEDTYRQNIDFIAEALGKNHNESSEETLNRYLNDGFYADHLKIYQKRPIYWLFTSGKKAGFKCLIYMHRYNEDTLARINGKYFLPESTRKKNELEELNEKAARAEGRDKLKFEKERQNLAAAYNEAIEYGQVLDHMANKYISIDLDDGVKVNYAKFQGIEMVTDGGSKVKKDLLAVLK